MNHLKERPSAAASPTFCPSFSSAPPLVFVSLFPVGHKRRRRTSFPTAWAHAGVAGIHCTFCMSNTVILINIRTPRAQGQVDLCVRCFILSGLSERWQNVSLSRQHQNRTAYNQYVAKACPVHPRCIYLQSLFRKLPWFTSPSSWIVWNPKWGVDPANKDSPDSAMYMAVKANQLVLGL